MATKPEEDDFDAAWSEASASPQEQSEQAPDAGAEDSGSPDLAIVIASPEGKTDAEEATETPAEEMQEGAAGEAAEAAPAEQSAVEPAASAEEAMTPEEVQKEKSWAGRLSKREEELKARAADLEAREASIPPAPSADVAEIESRIADQYGEEFVNDIRSLVIAYGKGMSEDLNKSFDARFGEFSGAIQSALQAMHESAILDAHPDLDDIVSSQAFKDWLMSKDEDKRNSAIAVLTKGMWPQIIRLVATYKDESKASAVDQTEEEMPEAAAADPANEIDPFDEAAVDAPASVAMRMPSKADGTKDDFDSAWDEATAKK
jgi:hypothetical protein